MIRLSRALDGLLPESLRTADAETLRRARLALSFTLALVFWVPVFGTIFMGLGTPSLAAILLVGGLLSALVPVTLRLTGSVTCAGNVLTLDLFGVLLYGAWQTGGVESLFLDWFVAVPMVAMLVAGNRSGLAWLTLSLASAALLACVVSSHDSLFRRLSESQMLFLELAVFDGIMIAVFTLSLIYERLKDQAVTAVLAANRAKSEFLANMSHELRTPLTAILGYTDAMLEDCADDHPLQAPRLQTIRRNGQHLLEVINDILDLSKIEAGKLPMENVEIDPARLVEEVVSLMQVRADAKALSLDFACDANVPAAVVTDPKRLRQILFNLIGNAVKFTSQGGVRIRLAADEAASGKLRLAVEVSDTGVGISPEQIGEIFAPFCQGDASTSRRFSGTGLGLTISRRLARMLGGDISVRSVVGQGSTFRLEITVEQAHASARLSPCTPLKSDSRLSGGTHATGRQVMDAKARAANFQPLPGATGPARPLDGMHVLLAEDGPDNRLLIADMLSRAGAIVSVVENGRAAVIAALAACGSQRPFDVILMDIQMPLLDGYAATRELRRAGYSRPIVALTAHAMTEARQRCVDAGCDAYATKPLKRAELFETLMRLQPESVAAAPVEVEIGECRA